MRKVKRSEILDYVTYEDQRKCIRQEAMRLKESRRIHLGEYLTFLFENTDTIRYQIQEMIRAEKIVRESAIMHEIDTYNELLGGPGELACVLLIGLPDPEERALKLKEWVGLQENVYLVLESGKRIHPQWDKRQVDDKLSSVQYLKFNTLGKAPLLIGVDHPGMKEEMELGVSQRDALAEDLLN